MEPHKRRRMRERERVIRGGAMLASSDFSFSFFLLFFIFYFWYRKSLKFGEDDFFGQSEITCVYINKLVQVDN